jgi:hypothetical protein
MLEFDRAGVPQYAGDPALFDEYCDSPALRAVFVFLDNLKPKLKVVQDTEFGIRVSAGEP